MRAIAKTKPGIGVELIDVPIPTIAPGEVLVKVSACGICGTDLHTYEWTASGQRRRGRMLQLPRILGHEPAGIVAEVGEDVANFKVGDRVASDSWGGCGQCYYCRAGTVNLCEPRFNIGSLRDGALAEYVLVPWFNLYRLPENISLRVGAMLEPLGVAVHALERATTLRPGDRVMVLGPGPIGILTALVARAGGTHVTIGGLARNTKRLAFARGLGFATVETEREEAYEGVLADTNGRGCDVIFDTVGDLTAAVKFVRKGGQVVMAGLPSEPVALDLLQAMWKELTLTANLGRNPTSWHRAISLVSEGIIDVQPLISHQISLEGASEAFDLLRTGQGMKILIDPNPELKEG